MWERSAVPAAVLEFNPNRWVAPMLPPSAKDIGIRVVLCWLETSPNYGAPTCDRMERYRLNCILVTLRCRAGT